MRTVLAAIGAYVLYVCQETGDTLVLLVQSLRDCRYALQHPDRIVTQMKRAGHDTLFIASGIGLFIGMVVSLQVGDVLRVVRLEGILSKVVAHSMVRELGPVITALLLAGRVGASIAAEIGTMQVNEEIDALHTLGISPTRFLAMPRFVACVIALPLLVVYASLIGIAGGAIIASAQFDIGWRIYFDAVWETLDFFEIRMNLTKATIFGAIVAVIACQRGFRTRGGAEGVGHAITSAVVTSFICIIISDYFVTRLMM